MEYGDKLYNNWSKIIAESDVLLLQREIPEKINILAARCAKEVKTHEITVILDMGGRDEQISNELVDLCDIISPNETETERLFQKKNRLSAADAIALAKEENCRRIDSLMAEFEEVKENLTISIEKHR